MGNKKIFVMAAMCIFVIGSAGCGYGSRQVPKESVQTEVFPIDEGNEEQSSIDDNVQNRTEMQPSFETGESIWGEESGSELKEEEPDIESEKEQSDIELEEELKRYRQEREDSIQESNGLVEGGSPEEDNYSFDMSGSSYTEQFDTLEMTEAYAAARIYITDTLGIKPDTKMTTYMCIDPRILEIYDDEDKGVAAGYDNSNIFVSEYCNEEGVWEYLILVRDGKGSAWEVIHHGNSYKK